MTTPVDAVSIDPLELSVLAHAVAMIAEEMGAVLVRSALSPNIRERRDASSALFDRDGRMIAQAAHIPVHLGAMPESVAAVRARNPNPGDVFLLNDPYHGGSHLPDLTMVEAVAMTTTDGLARVRQGTTTTSGEALVGFAPGYLPPLLPGHDLLGFTVLDSVPAGDFLVIAADDLVDVRGVLLGLPGVAYMEHTRPRRGRSCCRRPAHSSSPTRPDPDTGAGIASKNSVGSRTSGRRRGARNPPSPQDLHDPNQLTAPRLHECRLGRRLR